ncbi:MAG TPA: MerR family transcriptional regulator [Candidatus Aquilonibacter sp.]
MNHPEPRRYLAKEFATLAGVTVRTLHLYDRIGLLQPSERSDTGYRLYQDADLERLEQILALRFVGFSLERIKALLGGPLLPLADALALQREIVTQEQRRLDHVISALDNAIAVAGTDDGQARWRAIRTVIEAYTMQNDWSWTEKYYSPEALAKVEEGRRSTPPEVVEQGQRDWAQLIADVEAAAGKEDPKGARGAELAKRWSDLIGQFTKGDSQVRDGLNEIYNDQSHWPADFKRPWSDKADAFIREALA